MCMLIGYGFCISFLSKSAKEVVQVHMNNAYASLVDQPIFCQIMVQNLQMTSFTNIAVQWRVEYKLYTSPYHLQSYGQIV